LNGYSKQPVRLLMFIGTADDKCLRPHPFYQVHMVTGKTVTTICQEKMMYGTKVLEVPLLPESDMSASIDCAGILKLRNADIELKKGETNIGRKNTRVQFVFRVALPQQDGQMLWLQTASIPVECCKWITATVETKYLDKLYTTTHNLLFLTSDIKSNQIFSVLGQFLRIQKFIPGLVCV
ncbi:Nuclear factor of activated T-cells, cytoplasmic 3, partial [Ilyodon furcidens]